MSKRIFRATWMVALAVFVSVLALSMGLMYQYTGKVLSARLKAETDLAAHGVERGGLDFVQDLELADYRITWIDSEGNVLYDSQSDTQGMENHLERQEVRDAMGKGIGESSRYSTTMTTKLLYCARRLEDGSVVRLSISHYTTVRLFLNLLQPLLMVALGVLAVSFLVARRIAAKIVNPLNNMELENLQENEDYREIRPLINRINAQQTQLRKDQVELEKTEQIRREFTANVSHELKSPLHTISGYAELIKDGLAREEDVSTFAEKIYSETYRMTHLVEDIIELTRLDEGEENMEKTETDLNQIAENAVEALMPFAKENGVSLELQGETCPMQGVPHLIYGIIYNLCDNAVKYNTRGGWVNITVSCPGGVPTLIVSDNGIGIPEEHQDRIFERFYRVDKSHSKAVGGTGLGLSIVKHSAMIHEANISLHSVPGEGTEITVTFPAL